MNKKIVLFILFNILIIPIKVETAQFEGTKPGKIDKQIIIPDNNGLASEATAHKIDINISELLNISQTVSTNLDIEVASDVYSEKDRQVLYCPKGNYIVVRNRIYINGSDIDKVKEVRYFLHETFQQPEGVLGDSENNFEIWIWSWGGFPIKAIVTTKTGQIFEKEFAFAFKSKFEEAQSKGIPQIMRCM